MKCFNRYAFSFLFALLTVFMGILPLESVLCQPNIYLSLQNELNRQKEAGISYDLFVSGDPIVLEEYFQRENILVKYASSSLYAIHISSHQLMDLIELEFIEKIYWSEEKGELLNDQMLSNANVLGLKQIGIYDSLLDGRGVILGFIDSGLDYSHPDFINEDGTSRILSYWDQKMPIDSNDIYEEYGYGKLIVKDTLDYWIANDIEVILDPNSEFGHGTTVVGSACSNGRALQEEVDAGLYDSNYEGIASASEIIMVASDFSKTNWLASVADAVHFMLNKAQELGKPIVLNLSVGTYSGSHDANDPVGQLINNWFSDDHTGRFLVCAAGNSRTLRYHLGYTNYSDTSFSFYSSFNGPSEYGRMAVFESNIN